MPPIPTERRNWLPELALALRSIAKALAGQEPTPEVIAVARSMFEAAVPGHQVELLWFAHGYGLDPEYEEPGEPEYAVTIFGDRLKAGWLTPATDFPSLLSLAISN